MSKVSVIIPNYNNAKWLKPCIESCIQQSNLFLKEIIVVDDHSTDNSWQVLQSIQNEYPETVKIFTNPQKGANTARSFGFSKSTGSFIQWLDSDDTIGTEKFKTQVEFLENNENYNIAYSDWRFDYYEQEKFSYSKKTTAAPYKDYLLELISENWQPCHNYLLKRNVAQKLHQLQAWNPETKVAQDKEYFLLAALNGGNFGYVKGEFAVYNVWNKNSISQINFKKRLELQMIFDKKIREWLRKKIADKTKLKLYLNILNTHVLNACFYNMKLTINEPFSIFGIQWKFIHHKKIPFIPLIYLWQHTKFLLKISTSIVKIYFVLIVEFIHLFKF